LTTVSGALRRDQLLLVADGMGEGTAGFWQFEPKPNA